MPLELLPPPELAFPELPLLLDPLLPPELALPELPFPLDEAEEPLPPDDDDPELPVEEEEPLPLDDPVAPELPDALLPVLVLPPPLDVEAPLVAPIKAAEPVMFWPIETPRIKAAAATPTPIIARINAYSDAAEPVWPSRSSDNNPVILVRSNL